MSIIEPAGSKSIQATSLAYSFGAEISGLDLTQPLNEAKAAQIRDLLDQYKVLVIRDQFGISPHDLHAFSSIFGVPEEAEHPSHPNLPERPGVKELVTDATKETRWDVGDTWHTDGATRENTRCITVLQAIEVPDIGRDTVFADMQAVFEDLSKPMQQLLEVLSVRHSWGRQKPGAPPVVHPAIMVHPRNGNKAVYVNKIYSNAFVELAPDESDALLKMLTDKAKQPEYQLRIQWKPGTIAIWDNEMTQHYLVMDRSFRRVLHRCMMF